MQHLTYVVSMNCFHYYGMCTGRDRLSCAYYAPRVCTNLAPRPMTVIFGLGTKLHLRMHTRLENGVLRNRYQLGCAVSSL